MPRSWTPPGFPHLAIAAGMGIGEADLVLLSTFAGQAAVAIENARLLAERDRPNGVLTYVPRKGETPEKSRVVAPRLKQLVFFHPGPSTVV